ncbi:hypothetical protein KAT08_04325 [Candidatus Babeliales bacterium]|nr:hypothetical protein [Candidatus Babeliales bacterium]
MKVFKKSISFLIFSFFIFLNSFSHQDLNSLKSISKLHFAYNLPGFSKTLAFKNYGDSFELESALYLKSLGEHVYGFGLEIELRNMTGKKIVVPLEGLNDFFEIRTTEYDVVTEKFVVECKAGKSKSFKKINQFIKEQKMLIFIKNIYDELMNNSSCFCNFSFNKKGRSIFTLNGVSTEHQDVSLMSNWITGKTIEKCVKEWANIINILSKKSLIIMFKYSVSNSFAKILREKDLIFYDNINHINFLTDVKNLTFKMSELFV